jgi:cell division protein FtsI (penicillin-binding protein 3)
VIGRSSLRRLQLVAGLCLLPLAVVVVRVAWLQIVAGEELQDRAESQHLVRIWQPPYRGAVVDRNGEPLAYSLFSSSIVAEPARIKDRAHTAQVLAEELDMPKARIERMLRGKKGMVPLVNRASRAFESDIDLSRLSGVYRRVELKRVYPLGPSAAHLVGFLDHRKRGQGGVEKTYDEILRGHPGWSTQLRDGKGHRYEAPGRRSKPAVPGHTIALTIDATLQDVAASALQDQVERLGARGGALVAIEPATGNILAMVSFPTYDPERIKEASNDALRNRVVSDPYEPGSTFKLVAAATALEDDVVSPTSIIHCEEGSYDFGGFRITDHHPYGALTFRDCFAVSSNIAFAKVGRSCGSGLFDTARRLGIGSPTGIPLAGESAGVLRPPSRWSGRTPETLAIGYEVMTTPLQLAMAYGAVANDGILMRPQIVQSITDPEGNVLYEARAEPVRRALSPRVARTLREFMGEVVVSGTGKEAALSWLTVGGKTGTSEKLVDGRYSSQRHYASFVGLAPVEDPRIVCLIMIDEPKGGKQFGGSAAAPVFRGMMESWGRLPEAWIRPEFEELVIPKPPRDREGRFGPASAYADKAVPAVAGVTGKGVPDVRNKSLRDALQTLRSYGLTARFRGSGIVTRQDPPPGSRGTGPVTLWCSKGGAAALVRTAGSTASSDRDKGGTKAGTH